MQQRFDRFLDYVCGNIISKRERENARNELYDHLMCIYECNLAQGMDEEHAAIEAESSGLKKAAVTLCAFALVLAACAGFDAYRLTRKAEIEPYSTADIAMDADERARIENTLADYGVDREVLKLLPNSEIMRFRNTASIDKLTDMSLQDIKYTKEYQSRRNSDGKLQSGVYTMGTTGDPSYYFENLTYCVTDNDGKKQLLWSFELKDIESAKKDDIKNYADCLEFEKSDANKSLMTYQVYRNNDSFFILTREDGQELKNKPLNIKRKTDALGNTAISEVEFQCKPGMRIFYTADLTIADTPYPIYDDIKLGASYIHRKRPILWISERTPKTQIDSEQGQRFCWVRPAIRTLYVPYLKSEAPYEATTEPEEETTERVIHGNSIEEMAAS